MANTALGMKSGEGSTTMTVAAMGVFERREDRRELNLGMIDGFSLVVGTGSRLAVGGVDLPGILI